MRKFLLLLMVLGLLCIPVNALAVISNLEVILADNVVDREATYRIVFTTNNTLQGDRDTVTVIFPEEIEISSAIRNSGVTINDRSVMGLNFSSNRLTILVPASINIMPGERVEVGIASAVIKNPMKAGNYQIRANTSQESQEIQSSPFYITDYEYSNGVSKPLVYISTTEIDKASDYSIIFKTSANGRLNGSDKIDLTFPTTLEIPDSISGEYITINGYKLGNRHIPIAGRKVTLPLNGLEIPAGEKVEIIISKEANIRNIRTSEYNTLRVSTSVETREITSFTFELKNNILTPVSEKTLSIDVSPDGAGLNASYTINIKAGLFSRFTSMIDGIIIAFPANTQLPASIQSEYIKVNGKHISGLIINPTRREMIFTLANGIYSTEQIIITIDIGAGIKNPPPAQYKLDIGLLKSQGTILSDFYTIKEESSTINPSVPVTPAAGGRKIVLKVGSVMADVDNTVSILDASPMIVDNVTLVPLRFISTILGATIDYNAAGNYVTVKHGSSEMTLWVNSKLAKFNGAFASIQVPATLSNNRLMVPVRFISENFGAIVTWDGNSRSITIVQGAVQSNTQVTATNPIATPTTEPPSQYPIGYKAQIKADNNYINVRSGPSTSYTLITKLYKGDLFTVIGVQGDWYKVKLASGQEAWAASWLVDVLRNG